MADLEAVLADVSYLMAMEKSKSTPAARASKKIVLPDPSVRSVMHKYMEKNEEVSFEKIFHQKLGYLLFKEYCETLNDEPVPQLYFYEEIKKYERLETPEERNQAAKEIYDTYIMGELLGQTHRYSKGAIDYVHNHLARNEVPTSLFQPYIDEIYFILREYVYEKFLASDKYTRFCQWKNLELNIQLTMNDFSVHRIIGRGGFGEVYGCRKADTGKMYAMKCLDKKRIKMKQGEMLALNERIMLSLVSTGEDCPFIVNMTYAFQTPEKLYFVLDLMNGGDLHYHLSQHGVFCESEMRFYAAEVILGLEHMHNRYVVYRDLKPANILLDENGHIRISDLGLACDFSKKRPHASVGTHGYMAPEVLCKGLPYDSSADWFSLGCMLYKLLKGHSPFRQHKTRDKHEIDKMTMTMNLEMPDSFSPELKSLLHGLLQRDVHKRLGCQGEGSNELKQHPFFNGIDWRVVFLQRLPPPLIPARGEVNAADAFDIGSFDEEDTKHIKLTDTDQELYCNFPVVVSERWQHEIAETIFDYVNHEADKIEMKRKNKSKLNYQEQEEWSDCILHGYVKRLGGTFTATWLTRYMRLYPNRIELYSDSGKPELIFMDQIEEVCNDYVQIKNEQCIVIKMYNHSKYVFTNSDEIGLKEWHVSLKAAHKESLDLLTTMAEKATKIYGAEIPLKRLGKRRQQLQQSLTLQEQQQSHQQQQQQQSTNTAATAKGATQPLATQSQSSANATIDNLSGSNAPSSVVSPTSSTPAGVAARLEQKLIQDQLMSSKNVSRTANPAGSTLADHTPTTSSALSSSCDITSSATISGAGQAPIIKSDSMPPLPKPDVEVGSPPATLKEAIAGNPHRSGSGHTSSVHRHHRSSSSSSKSHRSRRSHHSRQSVTSFASNTTTSSAHPSSTGHHHHRSHRATCTAGHSDRATRPVDLTTRPTKNETDSGQISTSNQVSASSLPKPNGSVVVPPAADDTVTTNTVPTVSDKQEKVCLVPDQQPVSPILSSSMAEPDIKHQQSAIPSVDPANSDVTPPANMTIEKDQQTQDTPAVPKRDAGGSVDETTSSSSSEGVEDYDDDNSSSLVIDVDGKVIPDPSKRITSNNYQRERDLVAQYEKLNISTQNSPSNEEMTRDE